jgi:hypothetical protein
LFDDRQKGTGTSPRERNFLEQPRLLTIIEDYYRQGIAASNTAVQIGAVVLSSDIARMAPDDRATLARPVGDDLIVSGGLSVDGKKLDSQAAARASTNPDVQESLNDMGHHWMRLAAELDSLWPLLNAARDTRAAGCCARVPCSEFAFRL